MSANANLLVLISIGARLTLAVVLGVAGIGKLRDRTGTVSMLHDFGVSVAATPIVATALPILELLVAVGLFVPRLSEPAAITALLLLSAFTFAVAFNLAKGRTPQCRCFGAGPAKAIGSRTLVRNGVLAGIAACAIVLPAGTPEWSWFAAQPLIVASVALALGFGVQLVLLWQIVAQQGRILMRLEAIESEREPSKIRAEFRMGIPVGAPAPRFSLMDIYGTPGSLEEALQARLPVLLFFLSASCGPCHALIPRIDAWQRQREGQLSLIVVAEGSVNDNLQLFEAYPTLRVYVQRAREVSESYAAHGTPAAVAIGAEGSVQSALAMGAQPIADLVDRISNASRATEQSVRAGGA